MLTDTLALHSQVLQVSFNHLCTKKSLCRPTHLSLTWIRCCPNHAQSSAYPQMCNARPCTEQCGCTFNVRRLMHLGVPSLLRIDIPIQFLCSKPDNKFWTVLHFRHHPAYHTYSRAAALSPPYRFFLLLVFPPICGIHSFHAGGRNTWSPLPNSLIVQSVRPTQSLLDLFSARKIPEPIIRSL